MEVYYYNDEHHAVTVQVNSQIQSDGLPKIEYFTLEPQNGDIFLIDAPDGAILHVKRWERRIVLLSYIPAAAVAQLRER